jgi:hypothetical protein
VAREGTDQDVSDTEWAGAKLRVVEVEKGGVGATCMLDDNDRRWLLMGQASRVTNSKSAGYGEGKVEVGYVIGVRKGSASWGVEVPCTAGDGGKDMESDEVSGIEPGVNGGGAKLCTWTVVLEWTVLMTE